MDLIYINSGIGSVFSSQVIALLNFFSKSEKYSRITLLCGVRDNIEEEEANLQLASSFFRTIFFRTYPNYSPFNRSQKNQLYKAIIQAKPTQESVFHIRGELMAYMARKGILASVGSLNKVIVDVRGASREEVLEFQKTNPVLKSLKHHNITESLKEIDRFGKISVVSNSLKDYLIHNTRLTDRSISIVPCLASERFFYSEEKRKKIRKQFGLNTNEYLFVFTSGGVAGWQNNSVLIKIASNGLKVLNLSPIKIDHPNIINKFIPYQDVPGYLSAADIAIIFRDESIVNKVASPVKFSEYICSGLPVISNGTVDVITNYIKETGFGVIVKSAAEIELTLMVKLINLPRETISQEGIVRNGIKSIARQYAEIYDTLVNNAT